ncbi:permease family-domain-containing protein [Suillus subaureus]|uniref:Permease family-domain-containing protein n=1 Tax=Suillus subaureus TaxID=48587 RepID=A0A9P7EJY3_9AGAM|nr:permease family-domain-containing protein [Suillus subaureus]KAG1823974.1 permease family-domain-containing protein [Suillus subaureus]
MCLRQNDKSWVNRSPIIPWTLLDADQHSVFGSPGTTVVRQKVTTKHGWLGDYDYRWLCLPSLPTARRKQPPFFGIDDELPLVLAMTSGLQHALAMLAGLIAPPIIFASSLMLDPATSSYMISASLIGSGTRHSKFSPIVTLQVVGGYYLGTGLLSVVGTSFATLSTANAIFNMMYANGTCPSTTAMDGTITRSPCPDAYGMLLGTSLICAFLEIGLSFLPPRVLQRIFPPMVTGTVILMIGASLVGSSGILDWGGGSNGCQARPTSGIYQLCPTVGSPHALPWGSPQFIGLGFLSFVSIILTELFGSPFLKNASIIVGLRTITSAPAITFLWVHRFKINVYPPAILPMLAVYVSTTMEAIGDITASAEVSRIPVEGKDFDSRIQGGVLSDGIGGFISALFTVTPLSVFAQNNGVISVTRCANRTAGRWCCAFLIIFVPNPVLGGVTTFLFASVAVSGLRVLSYVKYTRRDRFILAAALSFGIGDLLVPDIFTYLFDGVDNPSKGLQGLFESITIVLSTPFLVSGIVALVLNLILPQDMLQQDEDKEDVEVTQDLEIQVLEQERMM